MNLAGAVLGMTFAFGVLTLVVRLGATRTPHLVDRVLPFVPAIDGRSRTDAPSPMRVLAALVTPVRGTSSASRLARAGRAGDVDRYRMEQVAGGLIGGVAGGAIGLLAIARGAPALALLVLGAVGVAGGVLAIDRRLAYASRRRSTRLSRELPTFAELLAFSVAAGESPAAAIERVVVMTTGELSTEFRLGVGNLRAGASLDVALRGVADRCRNPDVERFIDGIIVAVERGTPLVDVMRAQAADARAGDRRGLMESAGRKDVLMLVPIVFFILPTVVLVAIYPGIQALNLVVP